MGNPLVARNSSAQTAASALLSAADIWSTDNRASVPAEIPQNKKTETALAETSDNLAETPDNKATETAARAVIPENRTTIPETKKPETTAVAEYSRQ